MGIYELSGRRDLCVCVCVFFFVNRCDHVQKRGMCLAACVFHVSMLIQVCTTIVCVLLKGWADIAKCS